MLSTVVFCFTSGFYNWYEYDTICMCVVLFDLWKSSCCGSAILCGSSIKCVFSPQETTNMNQRGASLSQKDGEMKSQGQRTGRNRRRTLSDQTKSPSIQHLVSHCGQPDASKASYKATSYLLRLPICEQWHPSIHWNISPDQTLFHHYPNKFLQIYLGGFNSLAFLEQKCS